MAQMQIVLLGSGNVATHLALALEQNGMTLRQIYSRDLRHARTLSDRLSSNPASINSLADLSRDADLYLFAVSDAAIALLAEQMPQTTGVWAHTAGSVELEILRRNHADSGVLYPLQTFSKGRALDFSRTPVYIEAYSELALRTLSQVGQSISRSVYQIDERQRKQLHLAAVFACNFVNHLYHISEQLLSDVGLPPHSLFPLIAETAAKIETLSAAKAQTGPAARRDDCTMGKHLAMLQDPYSQQIYRQMSDAIINQFNHYSE